MKKVRLEWLLGLLMLVAVAGVVEKGLPSAKKVNALEQEPYVVVLDAGHGGQDPGKVGVNNALEKELNLEIAQKLKEELSKEGIAVYMTREDDGGLYEETDANKKRADLAARLAIIQEKQPDLVVSIHQNSYSSQDIRGPQTFYYKSSEKGKELAERIQTALWEAFPDYKRKAKANGDYYLLLHTACPTVIVECGFLSNWDEAELLSSEEYQMEMARAIAEGIGEYFRTN